MEFSFVSGDNTAVRLVSNSIVNPPIDVLVIDY